MKIINSARFITAAIVLVSTTVCAWATDNMESRQAAADRYLKVVPMANMVDEMIVELAKQVPREKQTDFIAKIKATLRADMLERISREAMVKVFTTDELNALADFYGSKHGASAMKKFGAYMGVVMPALQQEMRQAIQKLEAQQKK